MPLRSSAGADQKLRSVCDDAEYAAVRNDLLARLADLRKQYGVPDRVYRYPYVHLSRAERAKGKGRK